MSKQLYYVIIQSPQQVLAHDDSPYLMLSHAVELDKENYVSELQTWIRTNNELPGSTVLLAPSKAFEAFTVTAVLRSIYERKHQR